MPRPKKTPAAPKRTPAVVVPAAAADLDEDELAEALALAQAAPDESAIADLNSALADLGGMHGATITVNKVSAHGEERLGKYVAREFDLDSLRDRFGGGTYWLYAHVGGRLHDKFKVVFAKSLDEQRGLDVRPTPAAAAAGDSLRDMFLEMQRQNRENLQLVIAAMGANKPQGMDAAQVIDTATKLAALGNRGGSSDVDRLLQGIKLARELEGSGGDPGIAGVAMEVLQLLRSGAAASPAPATSQPALTHGSPQPVNILEALLQRALAQNLPALLVGAGRGSDPQVYAQMVLDQVPEQHVGAVVELLSRPEWFNALVKVDGRVVPYKDWFEALRNAILGALNEIPPETTQQGAPSS